MTKHECAVVTAYTGFASGTNRKKIKSMCRTGFVPAVVNQYKYPLAESRESSAPTNAG